MSDRRRLTPRELAILKAYAEFGTLKAAAYQLGIKPDTAKSMVAHAYEKLDVGSNIDAFRAVGWLRIPTIEDQPAPKTGEGDVWQLVIDEMEQRRTTGIERYGTPLQAHNGRDALVDAYQEALDLVVYLRQAIEERR